MGNAGGVEGNSAEIAVAIIAQGSKDHDRFPGVVFVMGPTGTSAGVMVNGSSTARFRIGERYGVPGF